MPETPSDLAWNFLMKVQALDVTARDSVLRPKVLGKDSKDNLELSRAILPPCQERYSTGNLPVGLFLQYHYLCKIFCATFGINI